MAREPRIGGVEAMGLKDRLRTQAMVVRVLTCSTRDKLWVCALCAWFFCPGEHITECVCVCVIFCGEICLYIDRNVNKEWVQILPYFCIFMVYFLYSCFIPHCVCLLCLVGFGFVPVVALNLLILAPIFVNVRLKVNKLKLKLKQNQQSE